MTKFKKGQRVKVLGTFVVHDTAADLAVVVPEGDRIALYMPAALLVDADTPDNIPTPDPKEEPMTTEDPGSPDDANVTFVPPEHETPDNPGDDMDASVANVKRRLGNVVLRNGSSRPGVIMFQQAMTVIGKELDDDGKFGPKTTKMIKLWQEEHDLEDDGLVGLNTWTMILNETITAGGYKPSLLLRVMEYISWCEVSSTRDVYGMAEADIGDGAGANYGAVQHNSYGSMASLLRQAGRTGLLAKYNSTDKSVVNQDIRGWMKSADGVREQNKYFKRVIFDPALKYIPQLGPLAVWPDEQVHARAYGSGHRRRRAARLV